MTANEANEIPQCTTTVMRALNDTLNVLNGKWKVPIIAALLLGSRRFKEMARGIPGITPKMLSKELKDLEINGMVKRTVYDTVPVSVEYELTPAGHSIREVIGVMISWGTQHRKAMIGQPKQKEMLAEVA